MRVVSGVWFFLLHVYFTKCNAVPFTFENGEPGKIDIKAKYEKIRMSITRQVPEEEHPCCLITDQRCLHNLSTLFTRISLPLCTTSYNENIYNEPSPTTKNHNCCCFSAGQRNSVSDCANVYSSEAKEKLSMRCCYSLNQKQLLLNCCKLASLNDYSSSSVICTKCIVEISNSSTPSESIVNKQGNQLGNNNIMDSLLQQNYITKGQLINTNNLEGTNPPQIKPENFNCMKKAKDRIIFGGFEDSNETNSPKVANIISILYPSVPDIQENDNKKLSFVMLPNRDPNKRRYNKYLSAASADSNKDLLDSLDTLYKDILKKAKFDDRYSIERKKRSSGAKNGNSSNGRNNTASKVDFSSERAKLEWTKSNESYVLVPKALILSILNNTKTLDNHKELIAAVQNNITNAVSSLRSKNDSNIKLADSDEIICHIKKSNKTAEKHKPNFSNDDLVKSMLKLQEAIEKHFSDSNDDFAKNKQSLSHFENPSNAVYYFFKNKHVDYGNRPFLQQNQLPIFPRKTPPQYFWNNGAWRFKQFPIGWRIESAINYDLNSSTINSINQTELNQLNKTLPMKFFEDDKHTQNGDYKNMQVVFEHTDNSMGSDVTWTDKNSKTLKKNGNSESNTTYAMIPRESTTRVFLNKALLANPSKVILPVVTLLELLNNIDHELNNLFDLCHETVYNSIKCNDKPVKNVTDISIK